MTIRNIKKLFSRILSFAIICSFLSSIPVNAIDYKKQAEERKSMEIESNSYDNWPLGPAIGAEAAILMDANTGAILYEKNIHKKLYPASITKLLSTYIAVQECDLDEMVTFSEDAVYSINWWEDANMGVYAGSSLTVEEVLYGILVGSANEAAYAIAEHVSGNLENFAVLMNKTAKELGCKNSNFVTPNGIHDENHYTTAYDMALIAKAFFSNDTLTKMSATTRFDVPVTKTQTREGLVLSAKSQLHPGKPYAYSPLVGTKTGYTDQARQTLVSCAEKNGLKLICVILKEEAPAQFTDTIELFNYGFDNFEALHLNEVNNQYSIDNHFFTTDVDLLGSSKTILSLNKNDYIVLPNTISFEDLTSNVTYDNKNESSVACINYYYKNYLLGKINVELAVDEPAVFDFGNQKSTTLNIVETETQNTIFINVIHLLIGFILLTILFTIIFSIQSLARNKRMAKRRKNKLRRNILHGNHWDIHRF